MLLGLPSAVANGTNRLGIWMGTAGSVAGFWRKKIFYPSLVLQVGWPGLLGGLVGSWVGVKLPEAVFKPILAVVIVLVVVETLRTRNGRAGAPANAKGIPVLRSGFWPFLA